MVRGVWSEPLGPCSEPRMYPLWPTVDRSACRAAAAANPCLAKLHPDSYLYLFQMPQLLSSSHRLLLQPGSPSPLFFPFPFLPHSLSCLPVCTAALLCRGASEPFSSPVGAWPPFQSAGQKRTRRHVCTHSQPHMQTPNPQGCLLPKTKPTKLSLPVSVSVSLSNLLPLRLESQISAPHASPFSPAPRRSHSSSRLALGAQVKRPGREQREAEGEAGEEAASLTWFRRRQMLSRPGKWMLHPGTGSVLPSPSRDVVP